MENSLVKISFIIASVDRDEQLQQCITSIENAHEFKPEVPMEIIVVVQKAKQKKNIQVNYPDSFVIYYIDQMGLSVARNHAIARSRGDYLVFIDDDATVKEDFISVLSEKIFIYAKVNAFCGKLFDPAQNLPFTHIFYTNSVKFLRRSDFQIFLGSAHILSRAVIEKIGVYDEQFGVGAKYYGSEESDMFFRLMIANERVVYLPDLIFFHPIPIVPPSYVYKYAYAVGAVLTKSGLNDLLYSPLYLFMALKILIKACVRVMQKNLLGGKYKEKDGKHHYGSVIKGTLDGIKDYLVNR